MTREELLERINDIRDELEELADDAESIDVEEKIVRSTAFKMPFADVKQMLAAGEINLFHVGDLIIPEIRRCPHAGFPHPPRRTHGGTKKRRHNRQHHQERPSSSTSFSA